MITIEYLSMTQIPDCPMCQAPNPWEVRVSNKTYYYKGQDFSMRDTEYSVCHVCGFDVVLPEQMRRNEARIRDEHRRIDGLLTGEEIKAIRKQLGLSQIQAAELIGGGTNAFSKYERGEVTQSVAMNKLLLVLAVMPDALAVLKPRKNSGLVEKWRVLSEVSIQVSDITGEPQIHNRPARRVNVERARDFGIEKIAA